MLCDHIAYAFLDKYWPMRCIGRIAFPIYALLLAEGFRHIKKEPERVSRHLGGYVILALVSEIGYDLVACDRPLTVSSLRSTQSVIFTLLLSFLGLLALDKWKGKPLYQTAAVFLTAFTAFCLHTDYSLMGVLLVYALYYYLNQIKDKSYPKRLIFLYAVFILYLPLLHWMKYEFCSFPVFIEHLDSENLHKYSGYIFVPPILAAYNGKLGYFNKKFKMFYKYFYPSHLLLIGLILLVIS